MLRNTLVITAYGMTEVSGASHILPSEAFMKMHGAPDSSTTVGTVMPNFKIAVR